MELNVGREQPWRLRLTLAVEFGAPTGVAEAIERHERLAKQIQFVLKPLNPVSLLTVSGKLRLKNELVGALNQRLTTAQVRRIYFCEFILEPPADSH